jgi:hypothetical protein
MFKKYLLIRLKTSLLKPEKNAIKAHNHILCFFLLHRIFVVKHNVCNENFRLFCDLHSLQYTSVSLYNKPSFRNTMGLDLKSVLNRPR